MANLALRVDCLCCLSYNRAFLNIV
jgi:hypothetical protein